MTRKWQVARTERCRLPVFGRNQNPQTGRRDREGSFHQPEAEQDKQNIYRKNLTRAVKAAHFSLFYPSDWHKSSKTLFQSNVSEVTCSVFVCWVQRNLRWSYVGSQAGWEFELMSELRSCCSRVLYSAVFRSWQSFSAHLPSTRPDGLRKQRPVGARCHQISLEEIVLWANDTADNISEWHDRSPIMLATVKTLR